MTADASVPRLSKRIAQVSALIGWAVGAWVLFWPHPFGVAMVVAALCPLVAVVLLAAMQGRMTIASDPKGDHRPQVFYLFAIPILLLALRSGLDVSLVDKPRALAVSALIATVLTAALWLADRRGLSKVFTVAVIWTLGCVYGWAVSGELDSWPDHAKAQTFPVIVKGRWESGGRGPRHHLDLPAWGPMLEARTEDVYRDVYDHAVVGKPVCVRLHPGVLHLRWYTVETCETVPAV